MERKSDWMEGPPMQEKLQTDGEYNSDWKPEDRQEPHFSKFTGKLYWKKISNYKKNILTWEYDINK